MTKQALNVVLRLKRKKRIRKNLRGSAARPRLSVFRSAKHIYAQVIDDDKGHTITAVSSFKKVSGAKLNKEACTQLGKSLAAKCKENSVERVIFDRNGYAFHGRVKAFADGAKEGGLVF